MMQDRTTRAAIAMMGRIPSPAMLASVQALYRDEQVQLADWPTAADIAYGEHPRQVLDIYAVADLRDAPVLLWVHGGGFVRGDKRSAGQPYNAHVGCWAKTKGLVGAVMNYRLAPEATWPAGGHDVIAAVEWLRANVGAHGGDPDRIVVMGTSAGSVHIATALHLRPDLALRAVVLLSGLYGFTPLDARDTPYYGDPALYPGRMPLAAVVASTLPLLVACAEFDPVRFQAEASGLLAERLQRHGAMPRAFFASGHNHFSLACHLGTADTRLADEVLAFIDESTGKR